MKLALQIDVENLSNFSYDTQTNLSELMSDIVNRIINKGAVADNLRHPVHGVALSYRVIPEDTDIAVTEEQFLQTVTEILALPAPTQGE